MLIGAISLGFEAAGVILAIIAAIPSLGISTAVGVAICAAGLFVFFALSLMNLAGNNKGLNINISRKWYLPNFPGINKKEPNGFNSIWDVFTSIKKVVSSIVKKVGIAIIKKFAQMYNKARKSTQRFIVLCKIIYDYYRGVKVKKKNYKML